MNERDQNEPMDEAEDARLMDLLYASRPVSDSELADADREALLAYREVQSVYREAAEHEPPAHLSAQLAHAAAAEVSPARRAASARSNRGFWARLLGPFVANPAISAFAGLVLVAGTAGLLYSRGEHKIATPSVAPELAPARTAEAKSPTTPLPPPAAAGDLEGEPELGVLAQGFADDDAIANDPKPARAAPSPKPKAKSTTATEARPAATKPSESPADSNAGPRSGVAQGDRGESDWRSGSETKREPKGGAQEALKLGAKDGKKVSPDDESSRPDRAKNKSPANVAGLHQSAKRYAKSGRCGQALKLAQRIRDLDPAYYAAKVRRDPDLARCTAPVKKARPPTKSSIPQSL